MITNDKITDLFCIADDFCIFFDAQMAKYSFKPNRPLDYIYLSFFS